MAYSVALSRMLFRKRERLRYFSLDSSSSWVLALTICFEVGRVVLDLADHPVEGGPQETDLVGPVNIDPLGKVASHHPGGDLRELPDGVGEDLGKGHGQEEHQSGFQ